MSTIDHLILLDTYVQEFWEKKDKRLSRILKIMDNVEYWVFDDEEQFTQGLNRIGRYISSDDINPKKIEEVLEDLVTVMAYSSSSKALRILNWLEEHYPELFQKMMGGLDHHDRPKAAQLTGARLKVFKNLDLMGKIFSPNRSQKITSWLKMSSEQEV